MVKKKESQLKKNRKGEKEDRAKALAFLEMPDDGWDEDEKGHAPYIKKDKRGRPTVMTKQTLDKLRTAFKIGCPDEEACIFAGIDPQTLYNYCKKNPDFSSEKEELKQTPILVARNTIVSSLKSSTGDAWEYLRRKRKVEFSDIKIEAPLEKPLTVEDLEAIDQGNIKIIDKPKKIITSQAKAE